MPRIAPLSPPYDDEVAAQLRSMMPEGVEPIALFRTFARNQPLARALQGWGSHLLSRRLSVGLRQREIVIDRTCARCGCEYEWGVHVTFFGGRAGLSDQQVASLAVGTADDPCWDSPGDRVLIRLVDALHQTGDLDDALWHQLAAQYDQDQLLELVLLCGWYHAISFTARAVRLEPEPWAAPLPPPSR